MKPAKTILIASLFLSASVVAQGPIPIGGEFQVNTYTTSAQSETEVTADPQGRFVVVWGSNGSFGTDTSYYSIQGQRYDANGAPVGSQFQVNSYTTGGQYKAAVAADTQGNFVVIWGSDGSYLDSHGSIQGQRYDASGAPVGGEFQVNSYTTGWQWSPAVEIDSNDNFVVVWESDGSNGTDTSGNSIQGQLFDDTGIPIGGQFQVNSYTTFAQLVPAVARDSEGDFVVVWASDGSYGSDTIGYSIQAQRYDATGTLVGVQFQVNTYTTGHQFEPAVAADPAGNFVVVWESDGSNGTDINAYSIQGQRFDATGIPIGGQFQVNNYTPGYQDLSGVTADSQGNFIVVWESDGSYGTDTSFQSIQAHVYDIDGAPVGGEFQVNNYTTSGQWIPAVAADPQGNFVVVWTSDGSYGTDTDRGSIQGQRYEIPIFADSFESGDTSAWSGTVP